MSDRGEGNQSGWKEIKGKGGRKTKEDRKEFQVRTEGKQKAVS
jgi:hypothetical protein